MSKDLLLHKLRQHLRQSRLIEPGERIIIAVSGGIDSMVLLDLLGKLKEELSLHLAVAHVNHQLRGQASDDDEIFVRNAAKSMGIECHIERVDTASASGENKCSIQEAARDLRYDFFTKLRASTGFQKIATAHHANDNAETMLFNFIRGAGVNGLRGIPQWRKDADIIRPLLFAERKEIIYYADSFKIAFREDASNSKTDYTRNFLRHDIIARIQEHINPNFIATLQRTSEIFDQLEQYLQKETDDILPSLIVSRSATEVVLDMNLLQTHPVFLQEHLLLHTAREFTGSEIEFNVVRAMFNLSHSTTGSLCAISGNSVMCRDREHLIFRRVSPVMRYRHRIELNRQYDFEQFHFRSLDVEQAAFVNNTNIAFVDGASLGNELTLRTWNNGDAFVPLGMRQKKKLSDFFIDEKIPLFEKQTIPLLISDGNIVWVCGKRLDDRYKITPNTTHVIKLEYQPRTMTL